MKKKTTKEKTEDSATGELVIQPVKEDESIKGTVGYDLRMARENKKLEIEKIAAFLRIKPCYLNALELSDYNDFPGQAYALGFLRTYSDFLGLDTQTLLARYRQERSFIKPEKIDMPIQQTQAAFPYAKYFIWSLFIIAFVWVFWYFFNYARIDQNPLNEIKKTIPNVPPVTETKEQIINEDVPEPAPQEEQKTSEVDDIKNESRIKFVANQDVWLEISQEDSLVFSRTLKKGENYDVPFNSDNMILKTGNAGGIDVFIDGSKVKALGPSGSVRSGISLSPDKLKNR